MVVTLIAGWVYRCTEINMLQVVVTLIAGWVYTCKETMLLTVATCITR